ncbi:SDR family NAD(P)-dependent oxidoreductase [Aquabacter spiritensis]|uniref:NADP-dependent 3-hydroxy acid dehydrogenase YdfG n=1 Tax=Aquabacter spiritensis TaxID=933073 RepID=A0A4R3M5J2_9HYPH|nr:SDR family NAD(P)-dependent oxidoreductase [Aquabacter spiritensis]TCT08196.1 NADP-dependent 3-hydroxy acid dehydrogenase YdfG [Aquabacter spiritensis]
MYQMLDPATLTVVVTGGTSGIGAATVRRFASAGSRVVAAGRRADRLQALAEEFPGRVHPLDLDVRDWAATQAAFAELPAPFADYNVVFANAGLALGLEPAHEVAMDDWQTMVDTNVKGLLHTVRAALPAMIARKQGHMVLTGSIAGDYPYPGGNTYGGTKAFVKQFSLGLWADIVGSGVRVTNIEPGLTETEFSVVRFKGDAERAGKLYDGVAPMTGEDIAEQVFFACTLPRHVNINRIQAMASHQGFGPLVVKR